MPDDQTPSPPRPAPPVREPSGKVWLVTGVIAIASILFCMAIVWLTVAREGVKW
jgi:hypothetical protein